MLFYHLTHYLSLGTSDSQEDFTAKHHIYCPSVDVILPLNPLSPSWASYLSWWFYSHPLYCPSVVILPLNISLLGFLSLMMILQPNILFTALLLMLFYHSMHCLPLVPFTCPSSRAANPSQMDHLKIQSSHHWASLVYWLLNPLEGWVVTKFEALTFRSFVSLERLASHHHVPCR